MWESILKYHVIWHLVVFVETPFPFLLYRYHFFYTWIVNTFHQVSWLTSYFIYFSQLLCCVVQKMVIFFLLAPWHS